MVLGYFLPFHIPLNIEPLDARGVAASELIIEYINTNNKEMLHLKNVKLLYFQKIVASSFYNLSFNIHSYSQSYFPIILILY